MAICFASGEGCFLVYYSKSSSHKLYYRVGLNFSLSQHSRDAELIKSLKYFGCGSYYPYSSRNSGEFKVSTFSDVFNKIIPFFQEYPIMGVKALGFADFCKVAELMK